MVVSSFRRKPESRLAIFPLFLSVLLILSSCVRNPVTKKREVHMISEKAELELGQEAKKEIVKEYGLYDNPSLQSYINSVGQKIVSVCDRKNIKYEFVVLDIPLVNAFAVPGVVFITRGILDVINDEDELAAVLGHEIGHVTNYHSVKLLQKERGVGFLATLATIAGVIYTPTFRDSKEYAAYYETLFRAVSTLSMGFMTGYGREYETQADRSGLRYAILAGYDPEAMIAFFKRLQGLENDDVHGLGVFLRDHPPTEERIKAVRRILATEPGLVSRTYPDTYQTYQKIVRELPKLDISQAGSVHENVYTNPSLKFKISVPKGWKLAGFSGRYLASFYSPDGKAQGELQMKRFSPEAALSADSKSALAGGSVSTEPLTSKEWGESVEEGLKLTKRSGREVVYPAGSAYVGTYFGRDSVGRPAFFKILYVVRGASLENQIGYVLSCAAPEETYLDYLVDFERIMESFNWTN